MKGFRSLKKDPFREIIVPVLIGSVIGYILIKVGILL